MLLNKNDNGLFENELHVIWLEKSRIWLFCVIASDIRKFEFKKILR